MATATDSTVSSDIKSTSNTITIFAAVCAVVGLAILGAVGAYAYLATAAAKATEAIPTAAAGDGTNVYTV